MKENTKNDYIQNIYKVVFYIEENCSEDLSLEELSKVASFSKYHFHRIFKSIIGESVGDFVRRVRLQKTTLKFRSKQKITDIALSSGYETNASFTKAFKNHFGITPKEFSKSARERKGIEVLEPKYVTREPIEVLSVRRTGPYEKAASAAAKVLYGFVYTQKIKHKKNLMGPEAECFGIGHDDPKVTEESKIRCDICVSYDDKSVKPEGEILVKTIEGGKYAQFLHKGPYTNLKHTYEKIAEWIVSSNVELRDLPMFEKYLNRDPRKTKPENLRTEIHVPIV
ncbi:MAG: AraC family transcriptional regulator [Campylobacterales bacterium]|nr:AraC family transcriptional regulator [Campylobacterales bacterium]